MMTRLRDQRGFTLTELLIVVALVGLMMGALFTFQYQGQAAYQTGATRVEVQQNARSALDLMLEEVRSALAITSAAGCDVGCTTISFTDQNGNAITYALAGTTLNRTDPANGTVVLIGGVASLTIQCFDATNTPTATAANVRSMQAVITTQDERGTVANQPGSQSVVEESQVRLRNLL